MSEPWEQLCSDHPSPSIELVVRARPRDLGGFTVRRSLPAVRRRRVGPFVFFDHMGPVETPAGGGMDVRPHPHIALATLTYLFEGTIWHRDSLGTSQAILPGEVNWMIAGKGIVHSERTPPEVRKGSHRMHGIQAWVGLHTSEEEIEGRFVHHPASALPLVKRPGLELRLISGEAYGERAPVETKTATLYADAKLETDGVVTLPSDVEERAFYVVEGSVGCEETLFEEGSLVVLRPEAKVDLTAKGSARVMILGGAPLDGDRFMFWNFVASSQEKIEKAKNDWREGRFPKVPGDDLESIPLPS